MNFRQRINDLLDPTNGSLASWIYDAVMLTAIALGTVPLLFRTQWQLFWYFDIISGCLYLVDYLLRWFTCDFRSRNSGWKAFLIYPFTPMAILDLLSILPLFNLLSPAYKLTKLVRLLKLLRLTKIVYYFEPLNIFVTVIKKQWRVLLAVLLVAFLDIFITAIIMFQAEGEVDPITGEYMFKTFFDAFYWAAITLTTVGFGDLYPVSEIGRALSIISSLTGIAVIALPSSIITAGYMQELNSRGKKKDNLPQ